MEKFNDGIGIRYNAPDKKSLFQKQQKPPF